MPTRSAIAVCAALLLATAAPAQAGWREDLGTFRIGMVAQPGAGQSVQGLSRIKETFSGLLSMPVEVFVARDLAALIEAQASGRIEYAVYPATAYALAWRICECVEPIAAPLGEDGTTGLTAVLVGRRGKADSMSSLAGVRVAAPPAQNVAAGLLARSGMATDGLDLTALGAVVVEAASATDAESRFSDGSVDAVLGWEDYPVSAASTGFGSTARLARSGASPESLVVLWRSAPLRFGPHAVRTDLDPEAKRLLVPFLTGLRNVLPDVYDLLETGRGGGFATVTHADYDVAVAMVDHASGGEGQ